MALLQSGAWTNALTIMNQLPNAYFMSLPNVAKSVCYLVHCTIEPLYRRYKHFFSPYNTFFCVLRKFNTQKEVSNFFGSCFILYCFVFLFSKLCPKGALGNVYRSQRGYPQPCLQYSQLADNVFPMLYKLGPYLSTDPVLFVKVVRVAKGFVKEVSSFC